MSLEEDLKARTLALISQQMANWVVQIQNQIRDHQGNLVRALDDLQESVARYDEQLNEGDIDVAIAEVVAAQPPPPPPPAAGPPVDRLRASIAAVERGGSLSEVLTYLINEVAQYTDRAAMFIVKGPSAIGWYGRGMDAPDAVKQINVPLNSDTVFRAAYNTRQALRGAATDSPATQQALARLGGAPHGTLAVPLILRDKVAAVLYCDTAKPEVPPAVADMIEILVLFAGKTIDLLSLAPKPAAAATAAPAAAPARPAAPAPAARPAAPPPPQQHEESGTVMMTSPVRAPAPPARPAAPPPAPVEESSSTVMFNASQFAALRQQAPAAPTPPPPPPKPAGPALSPEEQKMHEDAKRFARLVVSEIKLYNEAKVAEGRKNRDLYDRLKEDIERGRAMYNERVNPQVRDHTNYFYDELVRILAGGDQSALGSM